MERIERVLVTPIAVPDPPLLNVAGIHEPLALRTVVQVETTSGLIGLGETHGGDALLRAIRKAAEGVLGVEVSAVENARDIVTAVTPERAERAFAPLEVAMLDAFAQSHGCRVVDLLGGPARSSVDFAGYLFFKLSQHLGTSGPDEFGEVRSSDDIVRLARSFHDEYGFGSWKLKGGVRAIGAELESVVALREAFPESPLRLDPNSRWSLAASMTVSAKMNGVLEYLEDPCAGLDDMAAATAAGPLPTATNMLAGSFSDSVRTVIHGAASIVLLDPHVVGGLRRAVALSEMCAAAGIAVSMHSNSHLGISLAAMTHLAAAVRGDVRASDTHYPWNSAYDIIDGGPIRIRNGAVSLPDEPGLGVRLDQDLLAQAHERYLATDIRERNDGDYARRLVPNFGEDKRPWTLERSGWLP